MGTNALLIWSPHSINNEDKFLFMKVTLASNLLCQLPHSRAKTLSAAKRSASKFLPTEKGIAFLSHISKNEFLPRPCDTNSCHHKSALQRKQPSVGSVHPNATPMFHNPRIDTYYLASCQTKRLHESNTDSRARYSSWKLIHSKSMLRCLCLKEW